MYKIAIMWALLAVSVITQAQNCNSAIPLKAPDSRYSILADGAQVLDKQTGLIWQRCSLGQEWSGATCTGFGDRYTWQQALQAAHDLGNGWRLPNIKELQSLVEEACYSPPINERLFPGTIFSYYWTSTPPAFAGNYAYVIYFGYADAYDVSYSRGIFYARVVRSSQ
jgi:hypothetical protein